MLCWSSAGNLAATSANEALTGFSESSPAIAARGAGVGASPDGVSTSIGLG